jgi:GNAT superfamily N-acetyltransferase
MTPVTVADVASSLATIFVDDPFYRAITLGAATDEAGRLVSLARYFQLALDEARDVGRVDLVDADAAAIWITSDDPTRVAAARARKLALLADVLGQDGFSRYRGIVDDMDKHLPAELGASAWYLSILGVSAHRRGAGLAGQLLAPVLAQADAEQVVCFLETFNPRSLPVYERLGFAIAHSSLEPVTDSVYRVLIRRK